MPKCNFQLDNARLMSCKEIVATFVPCDEYDVLKKAKSSVVLGPRGCGKTTLMKMLTPEARSLITNESPLPFTAIYIQTDIQFSEQIAQVGEILKAKPNLVSAVLNAAMTTYVLISVVSCIDWLCSKKSNRSAEIKICESMKKMWEIPEASPIFYSIKEELRQRLSYIQKIITEATYNAKTLDTLRLEQWCYLTSFITISIPVLETSYRELGLMNDNWAFCFDELELAPETFQNMLFNLLRGIGDQRISLKITSIPLPNVQISTGSSPRDDYDIIQLWSYDRNERFEFIDALFKEHLKRCFGQEVDPVKFLGQTEVSPRIVESDDKYLPGSPLMRMYALLAEQDSDFRTYLKNAKISPDTPGAKDTHDKDAVLRKIKPLVYQRLSYGKNRDSKRIRSRKKAVAPGQIYAGYGAIISICEGNPRRLIRIINSLFPLADTSVSPVVKIQKQSRCIQSESLSFSLAMSSYHYYGKFRNNEIHMYELIEMIGKYFFEKIVLAPFSADPPGTFIADRDVSNEIAALVKSSVDCGAVIMCNDLNDGLHTTPRGQRFRLSLMLAPLLRLPLRTYKAIPLSTILSSTHKTVNNKAAEFVQLPLFEDSDEN